MPVSSTRLSIGVGVNFYTDRWRDSGAISQNYNNKIATVPGNRTVVIYRQMRDISNLTGKQY